MREPGTDQPRQAPGAQVTELDRGFLVRPAGSETACQLNNTASVVWELCDGRRTVGQIAAALAEAFGLGACPLAEITACVAEFRRAGILAGPAGRPAEDRADNPFSFFDAIYCLNLDRQPDRWNSAFRRFSALDIATQVERFPAISTPQNHHLGCTMSWRLMVATARAAGASPARTRSR